MMDSCGAGFEHCSPLHVLYTLSQGSWQGKIYIWMATLIVITTCNSLFGWLSIIHSLQHLNDTDMYTNSIPSIYHSAFITTVTMRNTVFMLLWNITSKKSSFSVWLFRMIFLKNISPPAQAIPISAFSQIFSYYRHYEHGIIKQK